MPKTITIVDAIIKDIIIPTDKKDGEYLISVVYTLLTDLDSIMVGPAQRRTITSEGFTTGEKQRITKTFETIKNKIKQLEGI